MAAWAYLADVSGFVYGPHTDKSWHTQVGLRVPFFPSVLSVQLTLRFLLSQAGSQGSCWPVLPVASSDVTIVAA